MESTRKFRRRCPLAAAVPPAEAPCVRADNSFWLSDGKTGGPGTAGCPLTSARAGMKEFSIAS